MARTAIRKSVRFDVFKRDKFTCVYCGATPPGVLLHIDHVIPVAGGGDNSIDNLVTACQPCNLGKSDKPLTTVPRSMADKAKEQEEREEQVVGYQRILASMRLRIEDEATEVASIFEGHFDLDGFPADWFMSIKRFVERLGFHECLESAEIAVVKKPNSLQPCFKYFCGVCWSKIKQAEGN